MPRNPIRALSYANVMATAAVFIALGGSSYAAVKITGKDVVNSSLTGRDIKDRSITGNDVKDGALLARDFRAGELPPGSKGDPGARGETGAVGDRGANGHPGPKGEKGETGKDAVIGANSITGAQVDESTFGTVPNANQLQGFDANAFERPAMGTKSLNSLSSARIIDVGNVIVSGTCLINYPGTPNGATVTLTNRDSDSTSTTWLLRNGVAEYGTFNNASFHGTSIGAISSPSPQVFVYQGIDFAGKLFRVTATSRYDNGTCHFSAWGATQP